jgi:hypothetical protein
MAPPAPQPFMPAQPFVSPAPPAQPFVPQPMVIPAPPSPPMREPLTLEPPKDLLIFGDLLSMVNAKMRDFGGVMLRLPDEQAAMPFGDMAEQPVSTGNVSSDSILSRLLEQGNADRERIGAAVDRVVRASERMVELQEQGTTG